MNDLVWEREPEARHRVCSSPRSRATSTRPRHRPARLDWLIDQSGAARLAHIEADEFFDFQQLRPQVVLQDGVTRQIVWPENVAARHRASRPRARPRDALRHRAARPLAPVLRGAAGRRRSRRLRDGRHPRRDARAGTAHADAAGVRLVDEHRARGAPRPQPSAVRGHHRARGRAARRARPRRASPRSRCGWEFRTTRPACTIRRRRWRCCATSST